MLSRRAFGWCLFTGVTPCAASPADWFLFDKESLTEYSINKSHWSGFDLLLPDHRHSEYCVFLLFFSCAVSCGFYHTLSLWVFWLYFIQLTSYWLFYFGSPFPLEHLEHCLNNAEKQSIRYQIYGCLALVLVVFQLFHGKFHFVIRPCHKHNPDTTAAWAASCCFHLDSLL